MKSGALPPCQNRAAHTFTWRKAIHRETPRSTLLPRLVAASQLRNETRRTPRSGVKQTLVDNLDPRFTFTYKMEYESSEPEPEPEPEAPEDDVTDEIPPEEDDAQDNVGGGEERTEEDDDVPTVPAPAPGPASKKKKSESGVPIGIVVAAVAAAAVLAFCTGAACCVMRRKKEPKTVYVDEGMELGEVSVLEQKATAISSEDLEATPVAELPPSVGKMI